MVYTHLMIEMYANHYSIEQLANILNIDVQLLKDKLNGLCAFSQHEKEQLAALFPHVTVDYLLMKDPYMNEK